MKTKTYVIISLFSVIVGILFFLLQQEIIIINYPRNNINKDGAHQATKKTVLLLYWHRDQWVTEQQELIWHNDTSKNLNSVINSWLTLLHEENIMPKKVNLQSALVNASGHEAYISFDRNPFSKQQETFSKWMLIEGLLKTVSKNKIPIQQIQFLVHHQPLQDIHLDFSKPWNISGFLD